MAKYRKIPTIVRATQWFPPSGSKHVCIEEVVKVPDGCSFYSYQMMTTGGYRRVSPGDWVVTGDHGEKYLCPPDIFERFYEYVEE